MHTHSIEAFHAEVAKLNRRSKDIFDYLHKKGPSTDRAVMIGMKFRDMNQVRPRITEMSKAGLIEEVYSDMCPVTRRNVRVVAVAEPQPPKQQELL